MATDEHNDWISKVLGVTIPGMSPGGGGTAAPPANGGGGAPAGQRQDNTGSVAGGVAAKAAPTSAVREDESSVAGVVAGVAATIIAGPVVGAVVGVAAKAAVAKVKAAKQVKDTTDKVVAMSDTDLKKLPTADKVKMVKDLFADGKPTGDARKAQIKIYNDMDLDPDFKKREAERGDRIAKSLEGDKTLQDARKNWSTLSADDKVKALDKILAAQSKEYGFPAPKILKEDTPPDADGSITNGRFNPKDGELHVNTNAASSFSQDFEKAVTTALHENGHNYQMRLVKDLRAGKIKPGDPDYAQATMFDVNDDDDAYIQPDEDYSAYKKQPEEDHSRIMGADMSSKLTTGLDKAAAAAAKH